MLLKDHVKGSFSASFSNSAMEGNKAQLCKTKADAFDGRIACLQRNVFEEA